MARRTLRLLIGTSALFPAARAIALDTDYGPFPTGGQPQSFPMQACAEIRHVEPDEKSTVEEWLFAVAGDAKPTVRIRFRESRKSHVDSTLEILDSSDKTIAGPVAVSDATFWGAYTADLNKDGRPDFLVDTYYHGCGLAAWNHTLVFAISRADKYMISSIFTMHREGDFVDLDRDGRCEMIYCHLLSSDETDERDRKSHSYWVFHPLEIKDGRWVVSTRDQRFPKWVWYTNKPNQKATRRLSDEAKQRLWRERGGDESIYWKPDEPAATTQPASGDET